MKLRYLSAASAFLFGFCVSSLLAQSPIDVRGPISIVGVSAIDLGDGQSFMRQELRLNGQTIATVQIEPKGSSPLAPAPLIKEESRIEWVVVSARLTSDNRVVASCELQDNGRVVAVMNVEASGISTVQWTTALSDPRYSVAVNTFRGYVRGYAIGRVAFSATLNAPVIVRVHFPEAVLDGEEGTSGLPTIR